MINQAARRRATTAGAAPIVATRTEQRADPMRLTAFWHRIHRWPRWQRWPLKLAILALAILLALYPKLWLLPTYFERVANFNSVLDPDNPALAPLEAQVVAEVGPAAPLEAVCGPLERDVYARIPYAFDWDTWGVMDYVPTVDEVFAKGREDCDGRAVVAASLLERLGFTAWIVSDLEHVWVIARDDRSPTPTEVELMGPGRGAKTATGDGAGGATRVHFNTAMLANVVRGLGYGVAVFPLGRELFILLALCGVALQPWSSRRQRIVGCSLLVAALVLWRITGAVNGIPTEHPVATWLGLAAAVAGCAVLLVRTRRKQPGPSST